MRWALVLVMRICYIEAPQGACRATRPNRWLSDVATSQLLSPILLPHRPFLLPHAPRGDQGGTASYSKMRVAVDQMSAARPADVGPVRTGDPQRPPFSDVCLWETPIRSPFARPDGVPQSGDAASRQT
jgi:hypothetical protein